MDQNSAEVGRGQGSSEKDSASTDPAPGKISGNKRGTTPDEFDGDFNRFEKLVRNDHPRVPKKALHDGALIGVYKTDHRPQRAIILKIDESGRPVMRYLKNIAVQQDGTPAVLSKKQVQTRLSTGGFRVSLEKVLLRKGLGGHNSHQIKKFALRDITQRGIARRFGYQTVAKMEEHRDRRKTAQARGAEVDDWNPLHKQPIGGIEPSSIHYDTLHQEILAPARERVTVLLDNFVAFDSARNARSGMKETLRTLLTSMQEAKHALEDALADPRTDLHKDHQQQGGS